MDSSDIDSESLQAVKSLKSKFENLAATTSSHAGHRPSSSNGEHLITVPSSPRRRASNSQLAGLSSSGSAPQLVHLRSSSSSSDLKVLVKRAPPPPPLRNSRLGSPSPTSAPLSSPLLRPVPTPPNKLDSKDLDTPQGVFVLRNKFTPTPPASPSRVQSPRLNIDTKTSAPPPPLIPPRPTPALIIHRTTSPEEMSSVDDDRHSAGSSSKASLPPPVPIRRASSQRSTSEGTSSPSASMRSSVSEDDEGDASPASSKTPQPPPVPARRTNRPGKHSSESSQTSYDSDASFNLPPPQRSQILNGISVSRPPARQRPSISPGTVENAQTSVPKLVSPPPPLPARRATVIMQDPAAPPLPNRNNGLNGIDSPTTDRRQLGANRLPPPPTRIIGLGDKLPPARRASTPSDDDESGEEDEPKVPTGDMMPDSSTSTRRPPTLGFRDVYPDPKIHVHPHSGCFALSGSHVVVGHGHHVKIYDLALSEVPIFNMDNKALSVKDVKVTCMEFRPTVNKPERGFLLWIGTKEGHLFEVDIRTGSVRGAKYAAHMHPITHIFRNARSMITLDETGKTLIFSPDIDTQEDISLANTVARVARTTEKQDFVKLIDGKLWTAARLEHHGNTTTQRMPVIRVFDIFNPANTGRTVFPSEHVGPVTSATIIPSHPGMAYLGHEEGYISMWELNTDDGFPQCIEVMRVAMSDVLSLEGVNNRLWAGSRNGMISAYDVSQKPWVVTNSWNAHPGLPVMKIVVNHYAITKTGRLCVASVGRDENMRLWDGLMGSHWVDKELAKLETSFSSFQEMTVLVVSWNCDSARPDSLSGDPDNFNFLRDTLHSVDEPPDVIAFGFQEVIDLESRKMVAKNVLLGGKKKADDGISEKVTGAYKRWYDRLNLAVKTAMPKDVGYCVVHTENLVGLFSCIFVKNSKRTLFNDVSVTTIKRGMGGRYGNKGGIVARFVIGDSSVCFINCHLAAGQNAVRRRNTDIAGILESRTVFAGTEHPLAYVGGGDGSMVLDHEFVILSGDMNYRIDHRRDAIMSAIRTGDIANLHAHDQLLREIKFNRACRLRGFSEGPLNFFPTYKYDRFSDEYDSSEKHRAPAWCDRVLWYSRVNSRVRQLHYRRYEVNVSDHRPISAAFAITVKNFDHGAREKAKAVLQAKWIDEQARLLNAAAKFYVKQAVL